jgi:F0F1-type ATP synthase assembly protein I
MKDELNKGKTEVNNYLKYSGLGFQIAATVGVGFFIGYELDKWLKTPGPYFTLGCSLVFLVLGFYIGFKGVLKDK